RVLVSGDDRERIARTRAAGVDERRRAGRIVVHVRQIDEREGAVGRSYCAAAVELLVAIPAVPAAEMTALRIETIRIRSAGPQHDIAGVAICPGIWVAEMLRRRDSFDSQLVRARFGRRCG